MRYTPSPHRRTFNSLELIIYFTNANSRPHKSNRKQNLIDDVTVEVINIVKDRSLRSRYRDGSYPSSFFPFYLYGTPDDLIIDHVLVRAPSMNLSADGVKFEPEKEKKTLSTEIEKTFSLGSSKKSLPSAALEQGALVLIENISEASMQPFQSTEGPLGDSLGTDSTFFFRSGQSFTVSVYEDPKAWNEPGPGLVDVSSAKLIGKGTLTLGESRYVDSVQLNRDPFEIKDGDQKFKSWKKIFDSIGKEFE